MRPTVALLCLCATLSSCARVECRRHGGGTWREVRTRHFTLQTDLDAQTAHTEALKLETLRTTLRWYLGLVDSDDQIRVVMIEQARALHEFTWAIGFVGQSIHPDELLVVTSYAPDARRGSATVSAHELTHRYGAEAFPMGLPRWVDEGLATYLETVLILDQGKVKLGVTSEQLDQFDLVTPLKLRDLWDFSPHGANDAEDRGRGYASAALVVHYLVNHEGVRWKAFLDQLKAGRPAREAFDATFPLDEQPDGGARQGSSRQVADDVRGRSRRAVDRAALRSVRRERVPHPREAHAGEVLGVDGRELGDALLHQAQRGAPVVGPPAREGLFP
jgi:hypothetical protein